MRTANHKIKSAKLSQKRYHPNQDHFNRPPSYNLIYPASSKNPSSPFHSNTKRTFNNNNKNLPYIHHSDKQQHQHNNNNKRNSSSSFNEDLSTLHSLWDDTGVTRQYRNVFESYIRTVSAKERRSIIDSEKESVLRIREAYSSVANELTSRKDSIDDIKEHFTKINTAYFEDKDDIDSSTVTAIQTSINKYRACTISVIRAIVKLRELSAYYVNKGKFDFRQSSYPHIEHNYLIQMKYDVDFIYKNEAFNKYFNTKATEPNDALLSNLPQNGRDDDKHYVQLNGELTREIGECKFAIAEEVMFQQVDDERKSNATSASVCKGKQDTTCKTLSRSSSAFYYSQFKSKSRPWSNSSRGNITKNMQSKLEELYKLYATPNQNMYLRQYSKNNKLSITLHKLKENNRSYNSMFMTRHLKMRKSEQEKDDEFYRNIQSCRVKRIKLVRDESERMEREREEEKDDEHVDKEDKEDEYVDKEDDKDKEDEHVDKEHEYLENEEFIKDDKDEKQGLDDRKEKEEEKEIEKEKEEGKEESKEEDKEEKSNEYKEDSNVDEEIIEDHVNQIHKTESNKSIEEKPNTMDAPLEKPTPSIIPLSTTYPVFIEQTFTSYIRSLSHAQKQLFNLTEPPVALPGAFPQVLLSAGSSSETDLPQSVCIYHKEYLSNQVYPNIIIDHLTSLDDSSLSQCMTDFISYIKQSTPCFESMKIKLHSNENDSQNVQEINTVISDHLERVLDFVKSFVELSEDNPSSSSKMLVYMNKDIENYTPEGNCNVLALKALVTYCEDDTSEQTTNDHIQSTCDKYMNCPLMAALRSLAHTNANDNKYNDILTLRKVDENKEFSNSTFTTLYKLATNEAPPSNIKTYASANLTPIIHNIVTLTHNNYYYNKITPLTTIKTFSHKPTNSVMHVLGFDNARYSLLICEMTKAIRQKLFTNSPLNIYDYFSTHIFPSLTSLAPKYTSIYLPSFNITTHLCNDTVDEYLDIDFIAEPNNIKVELPSNGDGALIINDTFIAGIVAYNNATLFPVQLFVVSKDLWKCN